MLGRKTSVPFAAPEYSPEMVTPTLVSWPATVLNTIVAESLPGTQDEFVLSLRNPGVRPRLAVPDFWLLTNDAELREAGRTIAGVLWADLAFEREYYMIERDSSASIPVTRSSSLPHQAWAELGADFVLAGEIRRSGEHLVVDLRMLSVRGDTVGRQAFGASYPTCRLESLRVCAHSIADDFHRETRALEGVARTKIAFVSDRDMARVTGRPSQTAGTGIDVSRDGDAMSNTRTTYTIGPVRFLMWHMP